MAEFKQAVLEDLILEFEIRKSRKALDEVRWITKEGKVMKLEEMDNKHLLNCIKMLMIQQPSIEAEYDPSEDDSYNPLEDSDILDKDYWDASDLD